MTKGDAVEFIRMSRERFRGQSWDVTYSALAAEAEAGTDGLSLLTVKGDSSGAQMWSHIDAQKAAGPDAALFRRGDRDVPFLAIQTW